MMILFCLAGGFILALLPHIIWMTGWAVGKIADIRLSYRPFGFSALALVILFWGIMTYGYFTGRWQLQKTEIEYVHSDIPEAFDGFRIIHISDLHLGTFDGYPQKLEKFVDEINSLNPDLICFTGDLVTIGRQEAEPYVETLRGLDATHGVMSVLGNHDFLIYGSEHGADRQHEVEELAEFQRETLGWNLLRNSHAIIEAEDSTTLTIIGVDNANFADQGFRTINHGDLQKAMKGTQGFRILLSHDPSHWSAEVIPQTDIPLTLSGHTHCAQVKILGWTPASLTFKETDGRYDRDGQTLYINIGLGCTAPFRIGAGPEITLITLHREQGDAGSL